MFGNDASYLRFRVQINWIFLAVVVVVIILAIVEGKVGLPVNLWPALVGKGNDARERQGYRSQSCRRSQMAVHQGEIHVPGRVRFGRRACLDPFQSVRSSGRHLVRSGPHQLAHIEPEQISCNHIERVHEFEVTRHQEISLFSIPARRRAQQRHLSMSVSDIHKSVASRLVASIAAAITLTCSFTTPQLFVLKTSPAIRRPVRFCW